MRKKTIFVAGALALVAVLFAGGLVASNMGFKLNYSLSAGGNSGTNTLSLPFNRQSGVDTANDLIQDIGPSNVAEVSRFIEATDSLETYTGAKGTPDPDFPLEAGVGNYIKMSTNTNYIVTGSHDPSLAISLDIQGGSSNSGTNFYAHPYHHTSTTAFGLMNDIGFANVAEVSRFLNASDAFETYTGRKGTPDPDFGLSPGEAYFIKMQGSTVNYVPSHY